LRYPKPVLMPTVFSNHISAVVKFGTSLVRRSLRALTFFAVIYT
jgi:hypothetical protein